ncbi:histidine phosphatase family protein [Vibrio kasasachensis]|uniref:histidine phosphatase family protein n=1 Tax=Vibrio kasasachensis TaxID=2910248 RepID=UPI003D12CD00
MRTLNVYLLRHGKVDGAPALYGHTDVSVSEEKQRAICHALLKLMLPIEYIVTSPLKRCSDLALQLHKINQSLPLRECEGFKEMNFGLYDGVPFDDLTAQWSVLEKFWQQPAQNPLPQAETLECFYDRISQAWQEFVIQTEGDTLLICHGGTIRMILASILGLDWANPALFSVLQVANQSLTHIKITISDNIYPQVCSIGTPLPMP